MPEKARIVVLNTTPIITLALAGQFHLIQQLYEEAMIPPAVRAEVMAGRAQRIGVAELAAASWLRTVPLQDPQRANLLSDLDRGEAVNP